MWHYQEAIELYEIIIFSENLILSSEQHQLEKDT